VQTGRNKERQLRNDGAARGSWAANRHCRVFQFLLDRRERSSGYGARRGERDYARVKVEPCTFPRAHPRADTATKGRPSVREEEKKREKGEGMRVIAAASYGCKERHDRCSGRSLHRALFPIETREKEGEKGGKAE